MKEDWAVGNMTLGSVCEYYCYWEIIRYCWKCFREAKFKSSETTDYSTLNSCFFCYPNVSKILKRMRLKKILLKTGLKNGTNQKLKENNIWIDKQVRFIKSKNFESNVRL